MGYSQTIPFSFFELGTAHKADFDVTTVAADVALNNIVIPSYMKGKVEHAFLDLYLPYVHNSNVAINHINTFTVQVKRFVVGGTWTDAISVSQDGMYLDPAQTADLGRFVGTYDVSAEVLAAMASVTPAVSLRAYQISSNSDSMTIRYSYCILRVSA